MKKAMLLLFTMFGVLSLTSAVCANTKTLTIDFEYYGKDAKAYTLYLNYLPQCSVLAADAVAAGNSFECSGIRMTPGDYKFTMTATHLDDTVTPHSNEFKYTMDPPDEGGNEPVTILTIEIKVPAGTEAGVEVTE